MGAPDTPLMMHRLAPPILVACLLIGCQAPAVEPSESEQTRGAAPNVETTFRQHLGRTWELAQLGDQPIAQSRPRTPATCPGWHPGPGSRPTIRFTAQPAAEPTGTFQAGGWSFCNGYGAAYKLGPNSALRFHQFQSTLVGCDGPDSLETRFFRALHDTRWVQLDSGTLVLIAADSSRLTFVVAPDTVSPARR